MKLNQEPAYRVQDTNQHLNRVAVSIHNTAHTMRILAQSTYTDPIGATVRETLCNAIDAHKNIKAGRPFVVTVPSLLDPNFKVRDFGCGMNEEFFTTGYAAVGFSTKQDSNDEIGGFGMGRFAAFAYSGCDQYYVKGYKDHKWFLGSVTRDADFNVFVQIENRGETTEPDGTEIIIPVNTVDFHKFEEKIQIFTEFVEPRPLGLQEPEVRSPMLKGSDWQIYEIEYRSGQKGERVVMGGVPYRLDPAKVFTTYGNPISRVYTADYHFAIGELSVAASREELRYDERTVAAIRKRFAEIKTELEAMQEDMGKRFATEWERKISPETAAIRKILTGDDYETIQSKDFHPALFHSFKRVLDYSARSGVTLDRVRLKENNKFYFFLADTQKWRTPYRYHVQQLAEQETNNVSETYTIVVYKEEHLKALGDPPFTRISTLPPPPKRPRTPGYVAPPPSDREFYFLNGGHYDRNRWVADFESQKQDWTTPKIYIPFVVSQPDQEWARLFTLYDLDNRKEVVGIPRADLKQAEDLGWLRFDEYFKTQVTEEILEAYSIWSGSPDLMRSDNDDEYQKMLVLVREGLEAPSFMPTAYNIIARLKKIADIPRAESWFKFLRAIGCPPRVGPDYEFDIFWQNLERDHAVLHTLVYHDGFKVGGGGYYSLEVKKALELACRAL